MKKLFYFLLILFTATVIASCADKDDENDSPIVTPVDTSSVAEYTICMYATAGGNLDLSVVYELLDNIDDVHSTNGKVRFVGIYKPSKKHQANLGEAGGTRYFELAYNDSVTQEEIDSIKVYLAQLYSITANDSILGLSADTALVEELVGEKYADADFKMHDPDNIAAALQYLTKKAPAKKYILLTDNHGGGWKFTEDEPLSAANETRGMVFDDILDMKAISLDELNAGVAKSGIKFDVLFCDLCLMAHIENLYGYSENFPICIASAETTTGSKIGLLAKRLAVLGANATHDQLFNECSDWVTTADSTVGYKAWDTYAKLASMKEADFQDMGCYNLTKIDNLTAPLTEIAQWFTNALADKDLKYVVEKSVLTTLYTTMPEATSLDKSLVRKDAIDVIKKQYGKDDMTADSIADELLNGADLYSVIQNCGNTEVIEFMKLQESMVYGYPMAYFVWNTKRIAEQYNMTKEAEELDKLLNNYMTALKGMCRIKCSYDDFPGCTFDGVEYPAMDPYLWTSPTVVITSLNPYGYQYKDRFDFSPWACREESKNLSLATALETYHNTKFDQLTSWSKFLEGIDRNPNVVTNVFRQLPVFYGKFGRQ